ncbi:MAG: AmmeMemoRadiSam system protein A [Candidatus Xenobium sp.]|jgi:AmmeMemoRadiSam system protein A|nr:AmmeMemoRadiSam system protein A [Burkholderiales bacterium]
MSENPVPSHGPHPLLELARRAVEEFVRHGRILAVPGPIPEEFQKPAGAFVTLKKSGELRGCIGTLGPTCPDQFREVVQNAISACSRDPRFPPVHPGELEDLHYQVYILQPAEPVGGLADLDPQRYGVIVHKSGRRGVLLPALEGIETAEVQVAIACRKAGIDPADNPELERFEVLTFQEASDEP